MATSPTSATPALRPPHGSPRLNGPFKMTSNACANKEGRAAQMPSTLSYFVRPLPRRDEHVVCVFDSIAESGAYARLLDYGNRLCFAPWNQLSKASRVKSFSKLAPVGSTRVLRVTRVDHDKGYVDVSARDISKAHEQEARDVHLKNNIVHGIMSDLSKLVQVPVPELYESLVTPLWQATRRAHIARKAARKAARDAALAMKNGPLRKAASADSDSEYQDELDAERAASGRPAARDLSSSSSSATSDEDDANRANTLTFPGDQTLALGWRNPLDVLRTILVESDSAWALAYGAEAVPSKPMQAAVMKVLARTVPPPSMSVKAVLSAVCYGPDGVDGLKTMLLAGKHALKVDPPVGAAAASGTNTRRQHVHIRLLKSPGGGGSLFSIQLPQVASKTVGMASMNRVLEAVRLSAASIAGAHWELVNAPALVIDKAGGKLNVKTLSALREADDRPKVS